jgi:hypothetical protein
VKQLALVVSVLVAGSAFAQEIGTEITPSTPNSGVQQQQPQNPPPSNTNSQSNTSSNPPPANSGNTGYTYKPKGSESSSPAAKTFEGPKVSASSGDFGIRASFGTGSSLPTLSSSSSAAVSAPSVGIAYFAGDAFKLLIDLGVGLALSSNASFSMNAGLGFDYLFRTPADAMRPFFHFSASFLASGNFDNIGVAAALGFGAEYFFAPNFAVNARLLLAVPMNLTNSFLLGIFTLQPGVGATWYL